MARDACTRREEPRRSLPGRARIPELTVTIDSIRVGARPARVEGDRVRSHPMRKLTVDDIVDLRAYERERSELRRRIIELKRTRRVALGPILTVLFENTET